jgi:hypothetical protein
LRPNQSLKLIPTENVGTGWKIRRAILLAREKHHQIINHYRPRERATTIMLYVAAA